MKKYVIVLSILSLMAISVLCITNGEKAEAASPIIAQEGEIVAYAAAFAALDENANKSKNEMIDLSKEYLTKKTDLIFQTSSYFKENSIGLSNANYIYTNALTETNSVMLSETEYEKLMPEDVKKVIEDRNNFLEGIDLQLHELEQEYKTDELPVLYYSIDELKAGLEESIIILNDYDQLMEGKSSPETDGYTTEDFYRLLAERIQAEQSILEDLNSDPDPDLYTYCLNLYKERERHPVIY